MNGQFCTFYLETHLFGICINDVQEILRHQNITPVPLANRAIKGLINLRGQIIMAIDLRSRLELHSTPPEQQMNLIVKSNGGAISLLVDRIGDVVETGSQSLEVPPNTLTGAAKALISGTYMLKDSLLLELNIGKTCDLYTTGN